MSRDRGGWPRHLSVLSRRYTGHAHARFCRHVSPYDNRRRCGLAM
ncbi:MAG: hypothetical protein QM736_06400 [Vicinamibacterales bacterium]